MLSFFQKREKNVETPLESTEFRKLSARLNKVEAEILDIATAQTIIRDKVLRKIQFKKQEQEEEEPNWGGIPVT